VILDIIYGVHKIIFAIFKSSQSGITAITNITSYIASMMVMVCNNFCGYSRNRTFSANRAGKRLTFFRFLLFHLFSLFGFRSAFVNVRSAFLAGWSSNYTM